MPLLKRYKRFVIVAVWVFVVSGFLLAVPFQNTWSVKELAASDGERVQLRDRRNKPRKTVETRQMRYLYAVETSMEEVAEIQADLLLVDGDQPNVFAGKIDGKGSVIGINFAMLDVLDTDLHAAAALIGHELECLRLDHGDKTQTRLSIIGAMRVLGGAALETLGLPGGQTVSDLTFTSIETKYSRNQERQADYQGVVRGEF